VTRFPHDPVLRARLLARAQASEELIRRIARLKLRVQVCIRHDRDTDSYKAALSACLDDVNDIVRAAAELLSLEPHAEP
jgi:hypothetical protein